MNKGYEERRKKVEEFYQNNPLVLIGMNDYAHSSFLTNNLLKMIAKEIKAKGLTIDAGSLTLNKSEHIDIMLGFNLTLEEIKIAQLISLHDGISNFIKENVGVKTQKKLDNVILKHVFNPTHAKTNQMDKIGISDLIKNSDAPLIIHSTGANNLMRILGENPYKLESDYKNNTLKYISAVIKASRESTVSYVLDGIKRNFENIYTLNPNAQIFYLGLGLQKVLKKEQFQMFKSLILTYNKELEKLCSKYNVNYIETLNYENQKESNLSEKSQQELVRYIVEELFSCLEELELEPKKKEHNKEIVYYEKEEIPSRYKGFLNDYKVTDMQLKEERRREQKIYEKTLLEAKRRNI